MLKIEKVVRDCVYTFAYFTYQGLMHLIYMMSELVMFIKDFLLNFIVPSVIDVCSDVLHVTMALTYELFYMLSTLCLQASKLTHYLSHYFLEKAENISQKKAW